ncbi:unknown protein [Microcystis aeruginosa NIES-843]|uniref:Uncharacterized protein n=1 Tax=Microcystis aeruginosa (strain NIES-843 / IAM M-2473) TaxID=449447 RepID=B0JTS5_MICAN|nr:unknown protein [Microcystis aeruginosa NIES-843]
MCTNYQVSLIRNICSYLLLRDGIRIATINNEAIQPNIRINKEGLRFTSVHSLLLW